MYCTNCKANVKWVVVNSKRLLYCDKCGRYWAVENNKPREVNPFAEEKSKKPERRRGK